VGQLKMEWKSLGGLCAKSGEPAVAMRVVEKGVEIQALPLSGDIEKGEKINEVKPFEAKASK